MRNGKDKFEKKDKINWDKECYQAKGQNILHNKDNN